MMPHPPCARSSWRAGGGFTMSKARNSRKPSTAVCQVSGAAIRVTHCPITSSMTTGPGSVVPSRRSASDAASAPTISSARTSSASATAVAPASRAAAHTATPTADPTVPGANGKNPA
mgnify:CR=1 FL=1